MIDFLFTNKRLKNVLNYEKKIGNFFLYTNYKPKIIQSKINEFFLFGKIYEKSKNIDLNSKKSHDGRYCLIKTNKNNSEISLDQFSRIDIYYSKNKSNFYISSNFNLILKQLNTLSINQIAIAHSLNVIGIRPPKKETFFNEISRIGVNEILKIKKKKIFLYKSKFNAFSTSKYDDTKIKEYFQLHQNYLKKLGKDSKKNIYMSSGFDSSYLAANQKSIFTSKNITGHTVIQKISKRSKIYNIFELNRINKLKKHFNFKVKLTEINLVKNFSKYSENISEVCGNRMMTNTLAAFMHYKLAKSTKISNFSDEVYAGEVSDGVHNFGFSQFFSLIDHESNGFREYSDKKMCYLYSPSFFEKIQKKEHYKDYIFKEISSKKYNKVKNFNHFDFKNIFYELCNSLFNSNSRLPLNIENNDIFKAKLNHDLFENLKRNYFSTIDIKKPNQIYSAFIYLYNSFHWQASTICTMYNFADLYDLEMYLPYWNPKLHSFLSKMPEEWGRGLEVKNIKYPLKESFRRYLDYPKILEEGYHSYMYDVKKYSDPILEIIINPETKKYILKIFNKYHPCDYLKDEYYNRDKIHKILQRYKKDLDISSNSNQIFRLYNISKFFYDIKLN